MHSRRVHITTCLERVPLQAEIVNSRDPRSESGKYRRGKNCRGAHLTKRAQLVPGIVRPWVSTKRCPVRKASSPELLLSLALIDLFPPVT